MFVLLICKQNSSFIYLLCDQVTKGDVGIIVLDETGAFGSEIVEDESVVNAVIDEVAIGVVVEADDVDDDDKIRIPPC